MQKPRSKDARIRTSHAIILAAWCGLLFLYGISAGPLYRTESLRAIVGRECLHGQWLFPVLYGEPFLTKPPGHYAAIGLCSLPIGEVTAASARLPSVFAATLTVFLMYGLFRRALDERAALLAALLLPTSVLWLDKVPSAEIDMTLVGWVTAAIVLFHWSYQTHGLRTVGLLTLSLLCVAGGTLTKWTAPAFFYLTVITLLAWRGELRRLVQWPHLLAVGVAGTVCALWVCAVSQQIGWETLFETVQKEAAYRFAPKSAVKGYPWGDVGTYPLLVLAAHLPLSFFALVTLRPSFWNRWDDRGKLLLQLLHCWAWPNLLFWTLVPNHNIRYALPMSPGLMGLGVMGVIGCWNRTYGLANCAMPPHPARRLADLSPQSGGEVLLVAAEKAGEDCNCPTSPPLWGERSARLCGPSEGVATSNKSDWLVRTRLAVAFLAFLALWLIAKIAFVQFVIPQRSEKHNPEPIAAELREWVPPDQLLYLFRLKDEGVMFYFARPALRLHDVRDLPPGAFAVLICQEWEDRGAFGGLELLHEMHDQQGDPIFLVRAP